MEDFWAYAFFTRNGVLFYFFRLYDNIRPPSVLMGCDYNLFKEGIEPIWEVAENKNGGRLVVLVRRCDIRSVNSPLENK